MTQLPSPSANSESQNLDKSNSMPEISSLPDPDPSQLWEQLPQTSMSESLKTSTARLGSPQMPQLEPGEMIEEPKLVYGPLFKQVEVSSSSSWRQGRLKSMSLKRKTILLSLLLSFLPAATIGAGTYVVASNALLNRTQESAQAAVETVVEQFALFMRERYGDIQVMAALDILTHSDTRLSTPLESKQRVLNGFLKAYPVYDSIAAFDLKGNVTLQSTGKALDNHSDRPYFQEVLKTQKPIVYSQVITSKSSGIPSVYVASPIREQATGQMIGVIRARIPVASLQGLIQEFTATKFENGTNNVTANAPAVEYYFYDSQNHLIVDSMDAGGAEVDHHGIEESLAQFTQQPGAQTRLAKDELLAYAPFRDFEDTFLKELPPLDWKAVVAIDRDVAFSVQRNLLLSVMVGSAGTALLLAAIASVVANRLTKPLLEAVQAVKAMGQGQLDVRLQVQGDDEISTLSSNLNQMATQLQGFTKEQADVARRAAWLSNLAAGAETMGKSELDQTFERVVAEARHLLAVDRVMIYRFGPEGQLTVAQEAIETGWPEAKAMNLESLEIPLAFVNAFQQGEPVAVANFATLELPESYQNLLMELQVQSELIIPMINDAQLSGLLVAQMGRTLRDWQESDITFMQQLSAQMGIAQLLQEVQTARSLAEKTAQEEKDRTEELQRRVLQLLMEVDPVSQGDLTIRARVTEDEIGTVADSYNATIESLRRIVSQVKDAVQQVSTTAISSETAVQELSDGASKQTQEISEALTQIQHMADSIRSVANNAAQAEIAVRQATEIVQTGDAAMDKTVAGIFTIRETVGEAVKKVKRLGESSQKISKVVNLISSFAEQTNLLALNASIEAAHAGEEGRGFAVVADEVRSLARQSAAATAEIEALVAEIQAETNQVSAAMESGTEQVVAGTQLVEAARQHLTQIAQVSLQINGLVAAIAQSTGQQTEASALVSKVMTEVADIAQQTSSSATAVSDSFQNLVNVAQSLQQSVGRFKVS